MGRLPDFRKLTADFRGERILSGRSPYDQGYKMDWRSYRVR